jgi:hypothetical protein
VRKLAQLLAALVVIVATLTLSPSAAATPRAVAIVAHR